MVTLSVSTIENWLKYLGLNKLNSSTPYDLTISSWLAKDVTILTFLAQIGNYKLINSVDV